MGGNAELEALEESIFERPELAGVSEEQRLSLCDWIVKLVSDGIAQGRNDAIAENEMASDLDRARYGDGRPTFYAGQHGDPRNGERIFNSKEQDEEAERLADEYRRLFDDNDEGE